MNPQRDPTPAGAILATLRTRDALRRTPPERQTQAMRDRYREAKRTQARIIQAAPRDPGAVIRAEWERIRPHLIEAMIDRMLPKPIPSIGRQDRWKLVTGTYERRKAVLQVEQLIASQCSIIVLAGDVGRGKTMAACTVLAAAARRCAERWANEYTEYLAKMGPHVVAEHLPEEARVAARRALEDARPGRLVVSSALRRYWLRWAGDPSGIELIQGPAAPETLLLEDLGTETPDGHWSTAFGEMIDERMSGDFQTVITTNLGPEAIRQRYGARVHSRLKGAGVWVHVQGPDLRLEKRR